MLYLTPPCPPGGTLIQLGSAKTDPDLGWSDASIRHGIVGIGYIIRRANGAILCECSSQAPEKTTDSTRAELIALSALIKKARGYGIENFYVFVDSYQLLEHLQRMLWEGRYRYAELIDIAAAIREFSGFAIQNVDNRKMKRADTLARQAIQLPT